MPMVTTSCAVLHFVRKHVFSTITIAILLYQTRISVNATSSVSVHASQLHPQPCVSVGDTYACKVRMSASENPIFEEDDNENIQIDKTPIQQDIPKESPTKFNDQKADTNKRMGRQGPPTLPERYRNSKPIPSFIRKRRRKKEAGEAISTSEQKRRAGRTLHQTTESGGFDATVAGSYTVDQRRAVEYCMEQASLWWPSTIKVDVLVNFSALGGPRVLGRGRPTAYWQIKNTIYPVALAEAVSNKTLNRGKIDIDGEIREEHYDVFIALNSETEWHTGTSDSSFLDGARYDLVTVCLHELVHGLFMTGGNLIVQRQDSTEGNAGDVYVATLFEPQYMGRFDGFMADANGCSVVKGYTNTALWLGSALTGNNLWFADPQGRKIARLFAPKPFKPGSSLYHLSMATYGAGESNNDMMTPEIGPGYKQHNIGPIVREIMSFMLDTTQDTARVCTDIGEPVADGTFIDGGSGNFDNGNGGSGGSTNQTGFTINFGTVQISGWIIVGIAVGIVVSIFASAFVVRAVAVQSGKQQQAPPPRRIPRSERVQMTVNGNTTGMV